MQRKKRIIIITLAAAILASQTGWVEARERNRDCQADGRDKRSIFSIKDHQKNWEEFRQQLMEKIRMETFQRIRIPGIIEMSEIDLEKIDAPIAEPEFLKESVKEPVDESTEPTTPPAPPVAPIETPIKPSTPPAPADPSDTVSAPSVPADIQEIVDAINSQRISHGLPAAITSSSLNQAAAAKSKDMNDQNYFSHNGPDGRSDFDFVKDLGYQYRAIGSNIARGDFGGAEGLVQAWMDSPGHRANILADFGRELGVGAHNEYYTMFIANPL